MVPKTPVILRREPVKQRIGVEALTGKVARRGLPDGDKPSLQRFLEIQSHPGSKEPIPAKTEKVAERLECETPVSLFWSPLKHGNVFSWRSSSLCSPLLRLASGAKTGRVAQESFTLRLSQIRT